MAKPVPEEEVKKVPSLNRIIAEINKKAGENIIGRFIDMPNLQMERLPTGIPQLDTVLGGGLPAGKIVELFGRESTGKSLISMFVIKEAQKAGKQCIYLDVEDTFDVEWAKRLGVNTDELVISQSAIGEDTLELLIKLLEAEPAVIVVDSVAAMVTRAELEENVEKAFMAPKARLMSKALAKINALNKKTLIIFINQLRATMAMYGPQFTTPGGNSLRHYASVRLEVKKTEELREDGKKTTPVIGQVVGFKTTKNKTATPQQVGSFKFFYEDCHFE